MLVDLLFQLNLNRHPPDDQLCDPSFAAGRWYLQERALARNARKLQPVVRSAHHVWDTPKLPSSRRTSPMVLAGADNDCPRVTLVLKLRQVDVLISQGQSTYSCAT
jgi:hypothetical protein